MQLLKQSHPLEVETHFFRFPLECECTYQWEICSDRVETWEEVSLLYITYRREGGKVSATYLLHEEPCSLLERVIEKAHVNLRLLYEPKRISSYHEEVGH